MIDCPAGRYGNEYGLSDPACTGPCSPGYYCRPDATTPTEYMCGVQSSHVPAGPESVYCPEASGLPKQAPEGFVTTPLYGNTYRRTDTQECFTDDDGHMTQFCLNGTRLEVMGWTEWTTFAGQWSGCPADDLVVDEKFAGETNPVVDVIAWSRATPSVPCRK